MEIYIPSRIANLQYLTTWTNKMFLKMRSNPDQDASSQFLDRLVDNIDTVGGERCVAFKPNDHNTQGPKKVFPAIEKPSFNFPSIGTCIASPSPSLS